ncbi:MAG: hypothetical protein PHQ04_04105 [Opitutaceae bacterium]|nr:hypothetical protein [Opitutaceae bacterium]
MPEHELHQRLLTDARNYHPEVHTRSLLLPYREVLLTQRARYMSYEQISATLARHGITVSAAAVGVFCRRQFTQTEIGRARREIAAQTNPPPAELPGWTTVTAPSSAPRRRGPNIARDDL